MPNLSFDVFWRDHGATSGLKNLSGETDKAAKRMQAFRQFSTAAAVGVSAAIVKFGADSIRAYTEAQTAQARLQDAFRRFPRLADTNITALRNLNTELAKKTRFDDDATASGQAVLAQFKLTGQQLTQITPLLQDYAAKTGRDLPDAAKVLGRAMLGNGRALKEIGIDFKDTGDRGENFKQIVKGLRTQVGGFATKEGATAAGKIEILKNQFGELEETAGGALAPSLSKIVTQLTRLSEWAQHHTDDVEAAGIAIAGLTASAKGFSLNKMLGQLGLLATALAVVDKKSKTFHDAFQSIGGDLNDAGDEFVAWRERALRAVDRVLSAWATINPQMRGPAAKVHAMWVEAKNDLDGARRRWAAVEEATKDGTKAIVGSGRALDVTTEKGRKNRAELRNIADSARALRERLIAQRASQKAVDNATDDARRTFIKTAKQMGANSREARQLADKFGLLDHKINGLNDKKVNIKFATNAKGVYKTFKGFAVNLTSPSHVGSMATGGMVRGPGTPTSDSIPTMLSNGEFVVNAAAVKRHRQLLEAINKNQVPEMAGGGYVRVNPGRFPAGAMDVPSGANAFSTAFAKATGNRLGSALAKVFKSMDFGGPGGGITGAAGGRVHYKGGTFTKLFARNLELIQRAARVSMRIFQGGFRPRTSYSGTSHAGDAVDFQVNYRLGRAFRKYVGAAGDRTGLGHWSPHIHAVPSPSHGRAGGSAIWQYRDYVRRGGARQSMRSPWGLAAGGTLSDPSTVRMSEFGPEKVLTTAQTKSFDRLVRVMDRSGGAANTYITINAPNYVGSQDDLRRTLVDMNRRGQLEVIKTR